MPAHPFFAVRRLLVGAVVLALVGSGCSGGEGGGGPSPTTTTLAVTTTVGPTIQQQLRRIVVQLRDLPAGWTAKSHASPVAGTAAPAAAAAAAYFQCMGTTASAADALAAAQSSDFVSGSTTIASSATAFKSPSDVQADSAALGKPTAAACLTQLGKAVFASGALAAAVTKAYTVKVTLGAGASPSNVVATTTSSVTYRVSGHLLTLNDHSVFLAGPRSEAHIDFYDLGTPITAAVKAAVIANVAARLVASG